MEKKILIYLFSSLRSFFCLVDDYHVDVAAAAVARLALYYIINEKIVNVRCVCVFVSTFIREIE